MVATMVPVEIKYTKMHIGGKWVDGSDGRTRDLIDPATGEPFAKVAEGTVADVNRAVEVAWDAYETEWKNWGPKRRSQLLIAVAQRLRKDVKYLGALESLEVGKRIASGEGEVLSAADSFEYFGTLARHIHGDVIPSDQPWAQWVYREPYGAVALIAPWNYPISMASWKMGPALAAGNTCVFKPASTTPLTALYLASVFQELGAPDGVVNVILGSGEVLGTALVSHSRIDRISITGGIDAGRKILHAAADDIKKVSLELGGKSPNIIFADAEWPAAMQGALAGIFVNSGQVCNAGSRVFIERKIYDRFVEEMVERTKKIRVGPGWDPRTQVGPLHSAEQYARTERYVKIGVEEGAKLLVGGKRDARFDHGYFFEPTIFGNVGIDMKISQDEIFGPVLCVFPFDTEEEVIEMANRTTFGLAAAVWTNDVNRAHRFGRELKAGTVWINLFHPSPDEMPWGGYGQSGIGRDLSHYGVEEFTQLKSVILSFDKTPQYSYGDD
jgi:betaine-aldehyde dehydrogenase